MSARMEYTGMDVEEAIANACSALNVAREQLEISIVSTGSAGIIFGLGRKKAVVRVALKVSGHGMSRETGKAAAGREEPAVLAGEKKSRRGRGKGGKQGSAAEPAQAGIRETTPAGSEEPEEAAGDPVSREEVEAIRVDLSRILTLMGCPSEIGMEVDPANKVHARISGEFVDTIVGPEGQTIDSLQYLMRKIITRKFPQKVLFALDAGGFRESRLEELRERALRLAAEVKESGKSRTIPAIGPAERRVVHLALQDDPGIRSRSIGEGLFKKVLIYLPGKGRRRPPRKSRGEE